VQYAVNKTTINVATYRGGVQVTYLTETINSSFAYSLLHILFHQKIIKDENCKYYDHKIS
jgi:hypothetical protein